MVQDDKGTKIDFQLIIEKWVNVKFWSVSIQKKEREIAVSIFTKSK